MPRWAATLLGGARNSSRENIENAPARVKSNLWAKRPPGFVKKPLKGGPTNLAKDYLVWHKQTFARFSCFVPKVVE